MKKIMMLGAAMLALQAVPAMAQDKAPPSEGGKKPHGARMFEEQDANKDGAISEKEFTDFSKKKFAEIDANKDGKITKDEAEKHHEAKRAEWKAKREAMKDKRDGKPGLEGKDAPPPPPGE